jgi:O-acetylserine/cysteine efflux transporter
MTARDMALAALTSVIWGFAFVASKVGLESFSAAQLTALRFLVACLPVLVIPRPRVSWSSIVLIGATLFTGQFLLLFFALTRGLSPGVASVSQQTQAFFTVLLAAVFLGDRPTRRQGLGMTIALAGLALVGLTSGSDLRLTGLGLGLAGAFSWAGGNVLVKGAAGVPIFPLVVWCSLVPPLPALLVSGFHDGAGLREAVVSASWASTGAVLYLGVVATTVAYALWGSLLRRYSTAVVAPFALLAPCTGVLSSAVILDEVFTPVRLAGMALILGGLAVIVLPAGGPWRRSLPSRTALTPP